MAYGKRGSQNDISGLKELDLRTLNRGDLSLRDLGLEEKRARGTYVLAHWELDSCAVAIFSVGNGEKGMMPDIGIKFQDCYTWQFGRFKK